MRDFDAFVQPPSSPESEAELVCAASACLDRFTTAFNACDLQGMDETLHFPHILLSGAERRDWTAPGQHPGDFFERLRESGWHATRYESQEPVLVSADKVHFVVTYVRCNKAGAVLSRHRNLWIVTRMSGRWGIVLRSY